jgi:hypothetical protein
MEMNASALPEVLRETDHVQERRCNTGVDPVPQALCSDDQTPPRNPVGPYVPDEGEVNGKGKS